MNFLGTENPLFQRVASEFAEARRFAFLAGERPIPCATPEGLMLLKLYALPSLGRQDRFERVTAHESDLASLLHAYPATDTERLLRLLATHMTENDIAEVRGVLADIHRRLQRFRQ